jgi:hypothetical protein
LAGIAAAYLLSFLSLGPFPTGAELAGAVLLMLAILTLSVGPRRVGRQKNVERTVP